MEKSVTRKLFPNKTSYYDIIVRHWNFRWHYVLHVELQCISQRCEMIFDIYVLTHLKGQYEGLNGYGQLIRHLQKDIFMGKIKSHRFRTSVKSTIHIHYDTDLSGEVICYFTTLQLSYEGHTDLSI
jgi:hypothetical protein